MRLVLVVLWRGFCSAFFCVFRRTNISIKLRINDRIHVAEVRVIDEKGEQVGIMVTSDALALAEERGFDLVEVSPDARPPVCKILDYGKYKYDSEKKEKQARKKTHTIQTKEIKVRPKIDPHDFGIKMRRVRDFLGEGNRVKVTVMFRGREMTHKEMGSILIKRASEEFKEIALVDQMPTFEGRNLSMILVPKKIEKPKTKGKKELLVKTASKKKPESETKPKDAVKSPAEDTANAG